MPRRYLFGPVTPEYAEQNLRPPRQAGECLTFDHGGGADLAVRPGDTWESLCARLPDGWRPDFAVLKLDYTSVPACLRSAPVPLVGLAGDWNLLWHGYRHALPGCDLVLTDAAGVDLLARAGVTHARPAHLYGIPRDLLDTPPGEGPRDIDVLFVGNMNQAVQRERVPWLARLARLAGRRRVVLLDGVFGAEYHALLRRAKIVFNRSIRGECNLRAGEAAAAGALLFQEAGNAATAAFLRDRQECVYYDADNLEALLEHYLDREDERRALADAARARAWQLAAGELWDGCVALVEREWAGLAERAAKRAAAPAPAPDLPWRCAQALSAEHPADPGLADDLLAALAAGPRVAGLHNALGLVIALTGRGVGRTAVAPPEQAAGCFRRAVECEPDHVVARLNLAEALAEAGKRAEAAEQARQALHLLARVPPGELRGLHEGHYPVRFDHFRVEWERAAWGHAGRPGLEVLAKRDLLRWRLHTLAGELTEKLADRYEAVLARPDLPPTRAALGRPLARAGRYHEALEHLRYAVGAAPFDRAAAHALYLALGDAGDADGQHRFATERRRLAQAAPFLPAEPWFAGPAPAADARGPATEKAGHPQAEVARPVVGRATLPLRHPTLEGGVPRVTLCMMVKDEEQNLPAILGPLLGVVHEAVVVDTGSSDRTKEVAAGLGAKVVEFPWCDSFAAARNEGLRHATGDWVFWADADDRVDEDNLARLRALFAGLRDENRAYVLKCACLPGPEGGAVTVVDHVRLFRNLPDVRWRYRVHEQILPAVRGVGGEVRWADAVIRHTGYQDPGLRREKLERDLRLLRLDEADHPGEPFIQFNLGSVLQELGKYEEALVPLGRSLRASHPADSIVRKLYALVAGCHRALGRRREALAACRAGREHYPDDAELLFQEGLLLRELGNRVGAAAALERLLASRPAEHFASVDAGLRGYKARHNLAVVYQEQGRPADAEAQWQAAVAERPDFGEGWLELGRLYLGQGRWEELERAAGRLAAAPGGAEDAVVLRARGHAARREFAEALGLLEGAAAADPRAVWPRLAKARVLLDEGRDPAAAERVLQEVLALAPDHPGARRHLAALQQRRAAAAATAPTAQECAVAPAA